MSGNFHVTQRAKKDLRTAWRYGFKKWGEAQADKYTTALYDRFAWLAKNPQIGKERPDLRKGYHSFPHEKHTIFYTIKKGDINIIGVVGDGQSLQKYFRLKN